MDDGIETTFLCEGCQTAESVAERLARFVGQATRTIDICIYSFKLCPEPLGIISEALRERSQAGVAIRIAYDAGTQHAQIDQPGHLSCDDSTSALVTFLGYPARAIEGERALMHNKYVVVDAATPNARVWTGSMNFTEDSWTLQENNVITLRSERLASYYANDFNELWVDHNITTTGLMDSGEATLTYDGTSAHVLVNFAPGEGDWIDECIANQIDRTNDKLTLAAVVITSTRIIKSMLRLMGRNVHIEGIYDWTQMEGVKYQWKLVPENNWKIEAFERIVEYGRLVGKKTTPYTPAGSHNFMHNKVMVLDDATITGSYNFSRHAQANAENILLIKSPALADTYRRYIGEMVGKYRAGAKP